MEYIIINQLKYLSLGLVISFFFIHKIILVLIGISIALFEILNKNIYAYYEHNVKNNNDEDMNLSNKFESETRRVNLDGENKNILLAHTIEELGFIPSIEKNHNIDEAL